MQDRARILLNHVYFSGLPQRYRMALHKERGYAKIVRHRNFSPRIVEWMTDHVVRTGISPRDYVGEFLSSLDNPLRLWDHAFSNQLSDPARRLLTVIAGLPPEVAVDDVESAFSSFATALSKDYPLSMSPRDFRSAMKELDLLGAVAEQISGCSAKWWCHFWGRVLSLSLARAVARCVRHV